MLGSSSGPLDFLWIWFWPMGFLGGYNHLSSFTYPRHSYTIIPEYQLLPPSPSPPPPPPPHTHTHTKFCKRKRFRKGRFFFFSNTLFRFKSTHVTGKIKFTHESIALTSITQRLLHVFTDQTPQTLTQKNVTLKVLMLCSFNCNKGKIGRKTIK